jgi:hypothetical protein
MFAHRTTRIANVAAVLLVACLGVGPASAQDSQRILRGQPVTTELTPQMSQQLQSLFRTGEEPTALPFTVPANFQTEIVCRPTQGGLQCAPVVSRIECPTHVTFEDPATGQNVTVDVVCSGPDSQGQCDCDFK